MPEILTSEPLAETITELQSDKAVVVKGLKGFGAGHGLTAADVPPEITAEAARPLCAAHPDTAWSTGAGYAGGGFGPYKICLECGTIFGKTTWKDGNQSA
jgi:hypothetical protein